MRYLVLLPAHYELRTQERYPVLLLLHGAFGTPEDWLAFTHLADYTRNANWIVVMPQGDNSYYLNAALLFGDRYEDYIDHDLQADVQTHYRTSMSVQPAIAGVSMGGFGALSLALKHPTKYSFVGSISNAADAPTRPLSPARFGQSWRLFRTFGAPNSATRRKNDPFVLLSSIGDPAALPFIYQACGTRDSLVAVNRQLSAALEKAHVQHIYRESPGGHDWVYWDGALRDMVVVLRQRDGFSLETVAK